MPMFLRTTAHRWSKWFLCVVGLGLAQCALWQGSSGRRDGEKRGPEPEGTAALSASTLRTLALPSSVLPGAKRPRTFHFAVQPPIWTVSLAGQRLSRVPGTPLRVRLGPGRHVLQFRHSALRPLRVVIRAGDPGRVLRHRMKWRPGSLLVESAPRPRNATFRFKAPAALARTSPRPVGMPITISFPKHAPVNATIQVYAVGYHHALREVQLVPNQRTRVQVKLRPLRRRSLVQAPARCDLLADCSQRK